MAAFTLGASNIALSLRDLAVEWKAIFNRDFRMRNEKAARGRLFQLRTLLGTMRAMLISAVNAQSALGKV